MNSEFTEVKIKNSPQRKSEREVKTYNTSQHPNTNKCNLHCRSESPSRERTTP